jgi:hypothetical protein
MSFTTTRSSSPSRFFSRVKPITFFAIIILTALLAFEMFNYSTTEYALHDLLGNLVFAGLHWATILSIAFCGIDFAGIARLFTPERGSDEPREVWYLFGAWLLAATMNAVLTWWGVSMAIVNHSEVSTAIMSTKTLTQVVPVFVALMVWLIRILIIGTISVAGDRFLWGGSHRSRYSGSNSQSNSLNGPAFTPRPNVTPRPVLARSMSNHSPIGEPSGSSRPEPTYHSMSMSSRPMPRPIDSDNTISGRKL